MEDFNIQNGIQRASGSEELDALQQRELRSEQMEFYQRANSQPFEGFGGRQGFKEFLLGVAILIAIGLVFKYVLHVGQ
ncbi:hypothetical protein [Streptomyces sp. NPDC006631]|uniref:hypothetical protein n=1 Tax=Streptomyces sp. NPDC006631 TaxID=3364752 RepID=UPI0036C7CD43